MEKEFIPYEQALALKELAFDEECIALYKFKKFKYKIKDCNGIVDFYNRDGKIISYLAPTFSQAFRWFRENYSLYGTIRYGNNELDKSIYLFPCINGIIVGNDSFKTQEEAELECLKKLIEITKTK